MKLQPDNMLTTNDISPIVDVNVIDKNSNNNGNNNESSVWHFECRKPFK